MSYRIKKGEALSSALSRIAAEETDVVFSELRHKDPIEAIHNARKSIKKLRALLRSLRVAFPKEFFQEENQRLAGAGRKISPLRDVHVKLSMLNELAPGKNGAVSKVRHGLERREKTFSKKVPALRMEVRRILGDSHKPIESWPFDKATVPCLVAGLKRIYKQGRKAFKTACKKRTPENLHEWRKKSKSLAYGLELIECLVPEKFSKKIRASEKLGEKLGDDHDLFMVSEVLGAKAHHGLARRIKRKRAKLQKQAFKIGKLVYEKKPGDFAKALNRHLV